MQQILKRGIDIVLAGTAIAVLTPVWATVALLVRLRLGSPVVFTQVRPGLNGEPFTILKFRTMTDARDGDGNLLPDQQRLTRFGRLLRSTSLDELPELLNVLRGDMSLVGPRPLLMQYLDLYTPEQARRMEVKPGLTGWAQVNGRNDAPWPERLALDVWYVDHWNLLLDFKIMLKTLGVVGTRTGVTQRDRATVDYFTGDESSDA